MKRIFFATFLCTAVFFILYLNYFREKWILLAAVVFASLAYGTGYQVIKNPKLPPYVEFNKVYRFVGVKRKRIILRDLNGGPPVAYAKADIVISERLSAEDNHWCELVVSPGQRRLEPAC